MELGTDWFRTRSVRITFASYLALNSLIGFASVCMGQPATGQVAAGRLSSTEMKDCSGLPCVDVTVADGKHLLMAIDTGDPASSLNLTSAKALGLTIRPYKDQSGKDVPGFQIAKLAGAAVGSGTLGDIGVAVYDMSADIKTGNYPKVDGSLGYTAFKGRLLRLDFAQRVVSYSGIVSTTPSCPVADCGRINLITFGKSGPPIVVASGFTVNSRPLSVQIDTMFSGTLIVYPPSVEKLGLEKENASKKTRYFGFTDGGVDMFEAQGVAEGFERKVLLNPAPVYFAGPKVHLPDGLFDGTIGLELLAQHRLNLDFSGMNVWID